MLQAGASISVQVELPEPVLSIHQGGVAREIELIQGHRLEDHPRAMAEMQQQKELFTGLANQYMHAEEAAKPALWEE